MNVRINDLTSNVHLTDARAMLTSDILQQITEEVMRLVSEVEQQNQQREEDMQIVSRISGLDKK